MYRTGTFRREMGMRTGPYTGGAVLVPWHALPLGVRRKLLATRPIAFERPRIKTWTVFALAVIATLGLVFVSGSGFGQVDHGDLLQTRPHAILYGLFVAGMTIASALLARRLFSGGSWLPWERAVLALDAIEVTPRGLVVRPFGDARDVVFDNGSLEIRYADGSTFRIHADDGERIERELLFAEGTLTRASLSEDDSVRVEHDPFAALRDAKGFSHRAHAIRIGETWTRPRELHPALVALVVLASFGVAVPLVELRNRWSDDAAFDYAHAEHVESFYAAYLDHGGTRHAKAVREKLLPRVVLTNAESHDSEDQLGDFLARFPGSPYDKEARDRLVQTCASNLWNAQDSFDAFAALHPRCVPVREAVVALHYADFRRYLGTMNMVPALHDALEGLVDQAEHTSTLPRIAVVPPADMFERESFEHSFKVMLHGVATLSSEAHDGLSLTIRTLPFGCRGSMQPRAHARSLTIELADGGRVRATWQASIDSDSQLFAAVTADDFHTPLCQPWASPMPQPTSR